MKDLLGGRHQHHNIELYFWIENINLLGRLINTLQDVEARRGTS